MEGLFNINSILLHVLNTAILFVALYFLLYKPVRKFMKAREDKINAQLQAGHEAEESRDAMIQQGQDALAKANEEAAQHVALTAKQAQERGQAAIEEANAEAKEILARAHTEAEHILTATRNAMVEEAANLAVEMAQSILQREITDDDQRRLVDEFLKKVE